MVRHLVFDPDGDVLFTLSVPVENTEKPTSDVKDLTSEGKANGEDERAAKRRKVALEESNEQQVFGPDQGQKVEECSMVEFLVSSPHLKLASNMFKAMLQPHFAEGKALQDSGKVTIPLFDDDPDAMEVVMNIVHGQSKKMTQEITPKLLAQIAVVVDKYQLQDNADFFTRVWVEKLWQELPSETGSDLGSYLCISWIFKAENLFEKITVSAMKTATGDMLQDLSHGSSANAIIPSVVIGKL